jgi:hypothetical protein
MCPKTSVRLYLDNTTRDSGSLATAEWRIPSFGGRYDHFKSCSVTVERFQPLSTISDQDENIFLRLMGGNTILDTYDSVESTARGEPSMSSVIAVASCDIVRSGLASSYKNMSTPMEALKLNGSPLGQVLSLNIAVLAEVGGVTRYIDALVPGASNGRDYYAVLRVDFDDADEGTAMMSA